MKQTGTDQRAPGFIRKCACVLLILSVGCFLGVSAPARAQDDGGPYGAIFGGFFVYPAKYINGGILHTRDSKNSFHVFSSFLSFDPVAETVAGEGPFSMVIGGDTTAVEFGDTVHGRWEARELLSWVWKGECSSNPTCLAGGPFPNPLHPSFTAGKMKARIFLFNDEDKKIGEAILTIYCSLPGIPFGVDRRDPDLRGKEQYRVKVVRGRFKGLDFKVGRSGTVFINLPKFL